MQPPLNLKTYPSGYRIQLAYNHLREYFNSIVKQEQILAILGHPIKRRIRDQEDRVILDIGDLITLEAVLKAQQADQLDTLLKAVYRSK
jgi:hypothetical protein